MPFGLINAGATFKRLMSLILRSQLGRNAEVYVDDAVIKSRLAGTHPKNTSFFHLLSRTNYQILLLSSMLYFGLALTYG